MTNEPIPAEHETIEDLEVLADESAEVAGGFDQAAWQTSLLKQDPFAVDPSILTAPTGATAPATATTTTTTKTTTTTTTTTTRNWLFRTQGTSWQTRR